MKITRAQEACFKQLVVKGDAGATAQIVANELTISYHAARRHLMSLVKLGYAKTEQVREENNKIIYYAMSQDLMPKIPHWHKDQPDIYLNALIDKLVHTNPDQQQQVQLTKRLGLYLATLAKIGSDWKNGISVPQEALADLKFAMMQAASRAEWQAKILRIIAETDQLWDPIEAPHYWFGSPDLSFTAEQASDYYQTAVEYFGVDNN